MDGVKQYPVSVYCPISHVNEWVFFREVPTDEGYRAGFDGCDHQFGKCEECDACEKEAYQKLINRVK